MQKKPDTSSKADLRRNPPPPLRTALIVAAYLCGFIILDLFSQHFEELRGIVAWYPPAGLTYALLLVFGGRFTPAVTVALLIDSLLIYRMPQSPYLLLLWAVIISSIYGAAAWFLRHRIRFDWQLRRSRDVTVLVIAGVLVSALLAVLSVSSSALSSDMPPGEALRAILVWWIGETVGVLTVAPFLLIHVMPWLKRIAGGRPAGLPARSSFPRPTLSIIGQAFSIVLVFYWVFGGTALNEFRPIYLITLPLIWIALDHGFKGVTAGIAVSNFGVMLAMWFLRFDLAHIGELQLLMIVVCIIGLLMGAVVTERKWAETALKQEVEDLSHLAAVVNDSNDAVIMHDFDGKILAWNRGAKEIYGYTEAESLGKNVMEIVAEPDREAALTLIQKIKQGENIKSFELRRVTKDGRILDVWLTTTLLRDDQGEPVAIATTGRDITERKQGEAQILRQVETLGILYDLSRGLAETDDFSAILDLLNRRAVEATHVTFSGVLLLENGDLVTRAVFPVRVLDQDLQVGQREPLASHPFCQRILEENTPRVLQAGSPEVGDLAPFLLGLAQTLCIVPLRNRERPLGLLILGEVRAPEREPFTEEKLHLARSIADQAASTLQRALLYEATARQLDQLRSLRAIDQTISGSFDLRMTLNVILEHVTTQLQVDAAAALLLNPHTQTLEYSAGRGFRTREIEHTHMRLGEGQSGRVALERRIVSIPDLAASDFLRPTLITNEGFVSQCAAPLIAKGQVKGVLEVFQRARLNPGPNWLDFLETLAGQAAIAIDNAQLFDNLQRSNFDLTSAYDRTIEGWSRALDLRDKETEGHTLRVTEITQRLARAAGVAEAELAHIRRGALLHDIGKIGVPDGILLKPGPLTDEEWVVMRNHPQVAYDMLSPIAYLKLALDIPYCHHEKWDGTGYPRGLKGEQIPLAARLFAVVDVWDALHSDRPYRQAWPEEKVLEYLRSQAGTHFDPMAVELFLRLNLEKPPGQS